MPNTFRPVIESLQGEIEYLQNCYLDHEETGDEAGMQNVAHLIDVFTAACKVLEYH